jgi:hypothetical protein
MLGQFKLPRPKLLTNLLNHHVKIYFPASEFAPASFSLKAFAEFGDYLARYGSGAFDFVGLE